MVGLRWVTFFVMLQFAAVTGQSSSSIITRAGDDVTLPCNNVIKNQDKCGQTSWLYFKGRAAEELIHLGQIGRSEMAKAKSSRLNVTADCSLVIKNVTREDVGLYSCRQFNKEGKQEGGDAQVVLSLINIIKEHHDDTTVFDCTVLTHTCAHTVQWWFDGNDTDVEMRPASCSSRVTFPTRHVKQKSKFFKSLKCNVTENSSRKTLLFDVNLQLFNEKTGLWRTIFVSVGLAALIISVVAINIWMRTKGNRTQRDNNAQLHDEEADEGTVTYENVGEPSASVRLH